MLNWPLIWASGHLFPHRSSNPYAGRPLLYQHPNKPQDLTIHGNTNTQRLRKARKPIKRECAATGIPRKGGRCKGKPNSGGAEKPGSGKKYRSHQDDHQPLALETSVATHDHPNCILFSSLRILSK